MAHSPKIINLDEPPSFDGMVREFLQNRGYDHTLQKWLMDDEVNQRRFASFIETDGCDGHAGDFEAIPIEFHPEFWGHFDFYTGFHGCFVENPQDYRLGGIRVGDPSEIYRIAVEKFGKEDEIKSVLEELRQDGYLGHNTGKVFAVQSINSFEENGSFCHSEGSELLRIVAKEIGWSAEEIYSSGEPSVIEFVAPKDWFVEDGAWKALSRSALLDALGRIFNLSWERDLRHSGMVLKRDIPPEALVKRYRCDQNGLPVELAEEY